MSKKSFKGFELRTLTQSSAERLCPGFFAAARRDLLMGSSNEARDPESQNKMGYFIAWSPNKTFDKVIDKLGQNHYDVNDFTDEKIIPIVRSAFEIYVVTTINCWKYYDDAKNLPRFVVDSCKEQVNNRLYEMHASRKMAA